MGGSTSTETVIIADLGNDIQITYSISGYVYTLNKLSLRIKQTDKAIFITNADGFSNSPDNQVIPLQASMVSSPSYADNDELYAGLVSMVSGVSLGGSGGGGGGNNTWSTKQKDFTAAVTVGTTNVTITALSWTFDWENVALIEKKDSANDVTTLVLSNRSVAAGVIALGNEDNFEAGDTVSVTLIGPDKGYDNGLDSQIVTVLNPDSGKWTSVNHLVELSGEGALVAYYVISMEGFNKISLMHQLATNDAGDTTSIKAYITNNPDADDASLADWIDRSTEILGAANPSATGVAGSEEDYTEEDTNPLKIMIVVTMTAAATTNAADIYIKKLYA